MDSIRLQQLFDNYAEKFESFNNSEHRETYKWSAVSHFQKYWDLDADNFGAMFKTAFEDSVNQIDVPSFQPVGGVLFLCKQNKEMMEKVRDAFRKLLAGNDADLEERQERIGQFTADMNRMLQETAPDKWKYHQDISSALMFLSFSDLDDNYMYREAEVKTFAEFLGVKDDIYRNDSLYLPEYYRLCDTVASELQQQSDLLQQLDEALETEADLTDDSSVTEVDSEDHLLVYDVIYCAQNYDLYEDLGLPAAQRKGSGTGEESRREEEKQLKAQIRSLNRKYRNAVEKRKTQLFPDLQGAEVDHARYGKGLVTGQEGKYITVGFGEEVVKKFLLPDALTRHFLRTDAEEAYETCCRIAEQDEKIQTLQRDLELLQVQLNG